MTLYRFAAPVASIAFAGSYAASSFQVAVVGVGTSFDEVLTTTATACYVAATRILTDRGRDAGRGFACR